MLNSKIRLLYYNNNLRIGLLFYFSSKPTASEVLTCYLRQCNEPPWTSYFVKVKYSNKGADFALYLSRTM